MSKTRRPEDSWLIRTLAVDWPDGYAIPDHIHEWGQLVYASSGVMTVSTPQGRWVVPPRRAVWAPPKVNHSVRMSGSVSMRTLYLHPRLCRALGKSCAVVAVSPLLRELILHSIELGSLDRQIPEQGRLIQVVLDQMQTQPRAPFELPLPIDRRARKLAEVLINDPAEFDDLDSAARVSAASKRTLERLFRAETNMSLGQWRQQARLLHAVRLLGLGEPVTTVALQVGYNSASAFIAAFKKAFGQTPREYAKS